MLLEVIDESLSILGEEPKSALYHYLMALHSLQREEIPEKTDDFVSGLKKALGTASKVMERLILKKLYQRIGSTFRESEGLEFGDYLDDARRRFEVLRQHRSQEDPIDLPKSKKGQIPG